MELSLMKQAASALAWPPHIQVVRVDGDSMYPTFKTGDFLAVDTEQRDVREGVYVFQIGVSLIVRRVHMPIAGQVLVGCDNKSYDPETVPVDVLSGEIVGRVIFAETRIY